MCDFDEPKINHLMNRFNDQFRFSKLIKRILKTSNKNIFTALSS